jgi:hypothetical protein
MRTEEKTMARNLILPFDGTWNKAKDKTNVVRMQESIDSTAYSARSCVGLIRKCGVAKAGAGAAKAQIDPQHCMAEINDSHREFAFGVYQWLSKRYERPFGGPLSLRVHPNYPMASDEVELSATQPS